MIDTEKDIVYTFRCPKELWREFNIIIREEGFLNAAEALRYLVREFVRERGRPA